MNSGLAPDIPESLYYLIKKAVMNRKHLEKTKKDKVARRRLILIESKIHRLTEYFQRARQLPPNWAYDADQAEALVA